MGPVRFRLEPRAVLVLGAIALLVSAAVPFWNVHPDEATYLQIALESREHHQWLDASYFGGLNFFKPPLLYAAIRASFFLFGDSLWAARLPVLACLFWSAVVVYRWAEQVAGGSAGLVAAALMLASPMALRFGHLAMMDVPLGASFLLAAVVGRRVREEATPPWPWLFLAVAGTLLLKGPALAPLVIGAFLAEAGLGALRRPVAIVWLTAGLLAGSSWIAYSALAHGQLFLSAFFGRENLGKFDLPWSPIHVLGLLVGLLGCAIPWRLWPLGFRAAQVPRFAKVFPLLALAVYSVPSVTFPQYMVCVLPAVALGVGVLSARASPRLVVAHVAVAATLLLTGAFITYAGTRRPDVACSRVEVVDEKPAFFQVWFRHDAGAPVCTVVPGACEGPGEPLDIPRQDVSDQHVLAALRQRSLKPLTRPMCLSR